MQTKNANAAPGDFFDLASWAARVPASAVPGALVALAARLGQVTAQPAAHNDELVDAEGLARLLDVPESHVMTLKRAGRIPHVKIGKYTRFDIVAVRAALSGGATT